MVHTLLGTKSTSSLSLQRRTFPLAHACADRASSSHPISHYYFLPPLPSYPTSHIAHSPQQPKYDVRLPVPNSHLSLFGQPFRQIYWPKRPGCFWWPPAGEINLSLNSGSFLWVKDQDRKKIFTSILASAQKIFFLSLTLSFSLNLSLKIKVNQTTPSHTHTMPVWNGCSCWLVVFTVSLTYLYTSILMYIHTSRYLDSLPTSNTQLLCPLEWRTLAGSRRGGCTKFSDVDFPFSLIESLPANRHGYRWSSRKVISPKVNLFPENKSEGRENRIRADTTHFRPTANQVAEQVRGLITQKVGFLGCRQGYKHRDLTTGFVLFI